MNQLPIQSQALDDPRAQENQTPSAKIPSLLAPSAFSDISHRFLLAYSFVAALSIALSQIVLGALLVYWLAYLWVRQRSDEVSTRPVGGPIILLAAPVGAFIASSLVSSLFGMSPHKGLYSAFTSSLNYVLPFLIATSVTCIPRSSSQLLARFRGYLWALGLGQGIAAVHTLVSSMVGYEVPPGIPGAVTESGQLVLVLGGVTGLIFLLSSSANPLYRLSEPDSQRDRGELGNVVSFAASSGLMFVALVIAAWPGVIAPVSLAPIVRIIAIALALLLPLVSILGTSIDISGKIRWGLLSQDPRCAWFLGSLLVSALVLNLKRGPWMGVLLELSILGFLLSRRLLWLSISAAFILIVAVGPARTRLFNLVDDFVIDGGRKNMWELGGELVQRFPLGVGFHNAKFMRELDPSLPELHRHMHNNLLNVTVESGWIGLACYLWWMYTIFRLGFSVWHETRSSRAPAVAQLGILALACTCGLIGWQAAGVVEYNFGDGEVRMIALLFMGLVLGLAQHLFLSKKA